MREPWPLRVIEQDLDNLRRKDSLRGAETDDISVRLGHYSASHFEGSAWGRGTPSRSQGDHYGGVLRSWELPQSFAIGGGGRTDIESPLGRQQGGLRNTLCHSPPL